MVRLLLNLPAVKLQADAADALAVALTHAHMSATAARTGLNVSQLRRRLPISEYEPRVIKQSLVGRGAADKTQVQHMVRLLLNLTDAKLQADAADALAVALTHAHMSATAMRSGLTTDQLRRRRG
jgi:crossover junction endodeoxyribonuclease RuvC